MTAAPAPNTTFSKFLAANETLLWTGRTTGGALTPPHIIANLFWVFFWAFQTRLILKNHYIADELSLASIGLIGLFSLRIFCGYSLDRYFLSYGITDQKVFLALDLKGFVFLLRSIPIQKVRDIRFKDYDETVITITDNRTPPGVMPLFRSSVIKIVNVPSPRVPYFMLRDLVSQSRPLPETNTRASAR